MNERIREIAEQAMVSVSYRVCQNTFKHIEDPIGPFVRNEFSKEKFAELIVREVIYDCMNSVRGENVTRVAMVADHWGVKV